MYPIWALLPVVILASGAKIIASQAVITGAFSLLRQGINLGFLPRMQILITSETNTAQIYVPSLNPVLYIRLIILDQRIKT
ncbi:KUP/HAK/KT family potassium transporter, partial [Rhizobium leguminosarum]|uniref:KUP/HAK/KT family potassium transporter n=1 Tax=Rhizobium leguminosarum TaxID=384 RepID=UPI003F98D4D6